MSSAPLLEIRDLAISFAQPRPAVNSISLRVERGEIVALVGESGSGKSMTARAVMGLLPPGSTATGSIRVDGRELLGADEATLDAVRGRQVALVFQEPQSALNPVRTIGWQLAEALRAHGVPREQRRQRAVELLRLVEIPEPERRIRSYPGQLSGGQKQRVALALGLANDPHLLIADEPTTALDVTVQAEILDLLVRLRDRVDAGILLITHNMGVVAQLADRAVVLKLGDVVEENTTGELFARPRAAYTRQLLSAVPALPQIGTPVDERPRAAAAPTLVLDHLDVVHPGRGGQPPFRAVHDVSFEVRAGEVVGLVGESGSGKTTIGRAATGLVGAAAGRVVLLGQSLAEATPRELRRLRRHVAFVQQDPATSLDPRFTVAECIREPLDIHRVGPPAERDVRVVELLDAVRLPHGFVDRRPHELSGGQRQRVALARALALEPQLVIADEPTSALDVSVQAEVLDLFRSLQRDLGFATVFISHDLAVVHDIADRVVVLRAGRIVEEGSVGRVFTAPRDPYVRALLEAVPEPDPARRSRPAWLGSARNAGTPTTVAAVTGEVVR